MAAKRYLALTDRALIRIAGEDARQFLQDLISNDIEKLGPATAIHAALLTPQGKYLHDFFAFEHAAAILFERPKEPNRTLLLWASLRRRDSVWL